VESTDRAIDIIQGCVFIVTARLSDLGTWYIQDTTSTSKKDRNTYVGGNGAPGTMILKADQKYKGCVATMVSQIGGSKDEAVRFTLYLSTAVSFPSVQ